MSIMRGVLRGPQRSIAGCHKIPPLGKYTRLALFFAIACGFWISFKVMEPTLYPVVKNFTVAQVEDRGDAVAIYGEFDKVRDCRFVDVVGYSGKEFVTVVFARYPNAPVVSRIVRDQQSYGPWLLIPKVPHIDLYAHHVCATGLVTTKLFSGALVL